jgi:hypothetical protein
MQTVVEKLNKTLNSINAHMARGGKHSSQRGMELIDRYNDLKAEAVSVGGYSNPEWKAYCAKIKCDLSHDAYDFYC